MRLLRATNEPISLIFRSLYCRETKSATGVLITDLTSRKEQVDLASRFQRMQDDERRGRGGIARELHDSVGQLLACDGMKYRCCPSQSDSSIRRDKERFENQFMEEVSREIRTISHLLHPPLPTSRTDLCPSAGMWMVSPTQQNKS